MQVLAQQEERYSLSVAYGNALVSSLCVSLAGDGDESETPGA